MMHGTETRSGTRQSSEAVRRAGNSGEFHYWLQLMECA